jgi:alkaline phosphatase D
VTGVGRDGAPRRRRVAALALILLSVTGVPGARSSDEPRLLVAVGGVTDRTAVVWARAAAAGVVSVELVEAGASSKVEGPASAERDFTVALTLGGLHPGTRHAYRVRWRDVERTGSFVTAPAPDVPASVRLLWSGDRGGGGHCRSPVDGYPVFRPMAARRPDLFVFIGDSIYADHRCRVPENVPGADFRARDLDGFRRKHRYNRSDSAFAAFLLGTSVEAIWDDHEVTNDFSGPTEPLMPAGRRAFLDYWPITPPPEEPTRLYRRARWGRLVELLILDTRQYRSPNAMPDGPTKTMLGPAQRAWLRASLRGSDAVWKLVVSSVSLSIPTGRVARDGWASGATTFPPTWNPAGFEHELTAIVDDLARDHVKNVVWLAADVHHVDLIRHAPRPGLVFHELVAGPLRATHGRPGLLDTMLHPTRLFGAGGYENFGELEARPDGLGVRILDAEGAVRFETTLRPEP